MGTSLTEIAQQLKASHKKAHLIYLFNGMEKFLLENLIKNYHFWQEAAKND